MKLLIDCPHCHHEVSVTANMETSCPGCHQPVLAESSRRSTPKRSLLQAALHYQGGAWMYVVLLLMLIPLASIAAAAFFTSMPGPGILGNFIQSGPLVFVALAVYFLPALIASSRNASNSGLIFILNLFMGVTVVGWIAAFIWAAVDKQKAA